MRTGKNRERPVYWNLIIFAFIGAAFAIWAMYLVDSANRSEIAVLYLGLIGGYAASIKELDLARMEIDKLRAAAIDGNDHDSENHEGKEQPKRSP